MNFKQYSTPALLALTGLLLLPIPAFAFFESILWGIVVSVLGTAVGLAGNLLDYAVNTFVIGFGTQYQQNGIGVAVDATWVVIRDFINMTFIFGLVYIGIKMILDSDSSNTRRWLVNLIIAALLINFSLFFTKFVIDVSNQFATAIAAQGFQTQTDGSGVDISQALVDKLGINTIFNRATDSSQQTSGYAYIFGTALILIIATFVFAAGAIMLIIRFVALNLFLVFSPVMFLSFILPPLQNISRDYWRKFLGRAFFAPLYLLFIYISFTVLDAMSQTGAIQNAEFGNYLATGGRDLITNTGNDNPFAFFIFAAILLIASLVVSNKLGADGASKAVSMGKDLSNRAQRSTTRFAQNTGKFAVRQTAGRAANAGTQWAGRRAANLEGRLNQRIAAMAQTPGRSRSLARLADRTVGAGLRNTQNASVAGFESFSAQQARREQQNTQLNTLNRQNTRADNVQTDAQVNPITDASTADQITARQEARRRQQNEVRDMTRDEILDRARDNREELMSPEFASLLTDAHVTALRESGILSNTEMDQLEENRDEGTFADITATLENSNATTENLAAAMEELNRVMSTMSDDRRQGMMRFDNQGNLRGPLANSAVASRLSTAHIDNMRQSGRASAGQMNQITDARNTGLTQIVTNGSLGNQNSPGGSDANFQDRQRRALFRNPQEAGRLPAAVLSAQDSAQFLTPRIIEEFMNNNPSGPDTESVRRNVERYVNQPGQGMDRIRDSWEQWMNRTEIGRRFGITIY